MRVGSYTSFLVSVASVVTLICGSANCAGAQNILPGGGDQRPGASGMRNDYLGMVGKGVEAVTSQWQVACDRVNANAVADLYADDAFILTSTGAVARGRAAIRSMFARGLPRMQGVTLTVENVVASGELVQITGEMSYNVSLPTGGSYTRTGPYSFLLRQQRFGDWLIQSQTAGDLAMTVGKVSDVRGPVPAGSGDTLRIRVVDASGAGAPGILVAFEAVVGGGSVTPGVVSTNIHGVASTYATFGPRVGSNVITATAAGMAAEPVVFAVAAVAGPPAVVGKVGVDADSSSATSSDSIAVSVSDAHGNPVVGAPVAFAVTEGSGSVVPTKAATDVEGRAGARFFAGPGSSNAVSATVKGLKPVVFPIAAPPSPRPSAGLAAVSSLRMRVKLAVVDSGATSAADVQVTDTSGAAMSDPPLTFASRDSSVASVSPSGIVRGLRRGQAIVVARAGSTSDSMLVLVAAPGGPVPLTDLAGFGLVGDRTVTISVAVDMREPRRRLAAAALRVEFDPTMMTFESYSSATVALRPVVDSRAAGRGSLALSFASPGDGFGGRVEVARLTFRTSAAGKVGALVLTPTRLTAAGGANLLAKTVALSLPLVIR